MDLIIFIRVDVLQTCLRIWGSLFHDQTHHAWAQNRLWVNSTFDSCSLYWQPARIQKQTAVLLVFGTHFILNGVWVMWLYLALMNIDLAKWGVLDKISVISYPPSIPAHFIVLTCMVKFLLVTGISTPHPLIRKWVGNYWGLSWLRQISSYM